MRKFVVNVNGNRYEVDVEEIAASTMAATDANSAVAAIPASVPKAEKTPEPNASTKPAQKPVGSAGSVKITAPMPGTILDIRVNAGDTVKKGTVIAILEAMKMENEILAPQDATIAGINVSRNQQVNSGDVIMTLN